MLDSHVARRIAARLPVWGKPRLGLHPQHAPRPLSVPAHYLRTRYPERAPLITMVTPSYEQGRFLGRAIHSVVCQNYPALEYIVQDGGSTDETLDVLRRFELLLTRWTSERDEGQADAINRGFRDTKGEIMAWLNSDDLLLPGSLAYVASYFAHHPEVDVVYGHRVLIDEYDQRIGSWVLPRHDAAALTLVDFVPQETLFWRRRAWDSIGGCVDAGLRFAVDWDLLLRLCEMGARIVRVPRYLGAFRVHETQKTSAWEELGLEECARLRKRVHGRDLSSGEISYRLVPYLVRHMTIQWRHQLVDRLPLPRAAVATRPN